METGFEAYHGRFANIRAGLAGEVDRGMGLIEELLKDLECTKTELSRTKLDLDNECEARRRLQQEVQESREWKGRLERRPFVVAVIDADADGYVFHDRYIVRGEKGGEDAADALLVALQEYVGDVVGAPTGVDILVRAFANVNGLGGALQRSGRLRDASQLKAFAAGFSNRQPFFDFVDVGPGKERADFKIRESIKFFAESFQCKHLVIACAHDTGYAPFLGQFMGDKQVAERITVLEGSPLPAVIRNLGLKTTRFSSVFNDVTPARAVTPTVASRGISTVAADMGVPSGRRPPLTGYHNSQAQVERLGPILKDESGRRVDRLLQVDEIIVERMKKKSLCYYLFLRGECNLSCQRNHAHNSLTDEEFDALWWLARKAQCFKSKKADRNAANDCSDVLCVYGHRGSP